MQIHLHNLIVPVSIGVFDWEKEAPQNVSLCVSVEFDGRAAAQQDTLEDTIDYAALESLLIDIAQARHYALVESMVSALGAAVLAGFPTVLAADVSVEKPVDLRRLDRVRVEERFVR